MKKIIIFIFICIFSSSIGAKENQSVWGKEEKTDTEKCQIAIEEGVSVKIKTSKSCTLPFIVVHPLHRTHRTDA